MGKVQTVRIQLLAFIFFVIIAESQAQTCDCNEFGSSGITLGGNGAWYWRLQRKSSGDFNESLLFSTKRGSTSPEEIKMILTRNGELGIGTVSIPNNYRVSINGNTHINGQLSSGGGGITTGGMDSWYWRINRAGSGEFNESLLFSRKKGSGPEEIKMILTKNGELGIGTTTIPDGHSLAVNGSGLFREIKVEIFNAPDYVFEPDYNLRSLQETKEYISENRHLPEIPSAKDMELNGIEIGDMNMRLLKKIEELTLHQIELLERIEELEKKVNHD